MNTVFKILVSIILLVIFLSAGFILAQPIYAEGIELDGNFYDWYDKPIYTDPKHDIKTTWLDFLEVRYFADNEYLYLYVKRLSAKKSQPWVFKVHIPNATYESEFDVVSYYTDKSSHAGIIVEVSSSGYKESTFSADNTNKEIEFRIPLREAGLNGINKYIKFMLESEVDRKTGEVDLVPDYGEILITTGSTFWQISSVIFFIIILLVVYKIYNKGKYFKKSIDN